MSGAKSQLFTPEIKFSIRIFTCAPMIQSKTENLTDTVPVAERQFHQYRLAIDIKSIRNLRIKSCKPYFMYYYDPVGTKSPILCYPGISHTWPTIESLTPNSFCAFEFVLHPFKLMEYLLKFPLNLEMWIKGQEDQDQLLGFANVSLQFILNTKESFQPEFNSTIRVYDAYYSLTWAEDAKKTYEDQHKRYPLCVGEIRVILALEDFGPIADLPQEQKLIGIQQVDNKRHFIQQSDKPAGIGVGEDEDVASFEKPSYHSGDMSSNLVSEELQLWQMEQRSIFLRRLLSYENRLSRVFFEWKNQLTYMQKSNHSEMIQNLVELEISFEKVLSDTQNRTNFLCQKELLMKKSLERNHQNSKNSMQRIKNALEELRYQITSALNLEKQKNDDCRQTLSTLEQDRNFLKDAITQSDKKLINSLEQHDTFAEKVETEKSNNTKLLMQLESCKAAKLNYKAKLKKALCALHSLKMYRNSVVERWNSIEKKHLVGLERMSKLADEEQTMYCYKQDLCELRLLANDLLSSVKKCENDTTAFESFYGGKYLTTCDSDT